VLCCVCSSPRFRHDTRSITVRTLRIGDVIGQTNNVLCYFGKLDSVTKHKLFSTYCTSMYGCQLWSDDSSVTVNDLCTAWRKGLRRIWSVPYTTLMVTFYMVCLVIYQFMMKYASVSLHFVATCLHHWCDLISFFCTAWYYMCSWHFNIWQKYHYLLGAV